MNGAALPKYRRWYVDGHCSNCGGAVRFHLSTEDDWPGINIVILGPPRNPQYWTCPHCHKDATGDFDGFLGLVRKPRKKKGEG